MKNGLKQDSRRGPKPGGKPAAKPPSQRQLRVAEDIRHVLAGLFARGGFRDPDLMDAQITVSEVRITPDLRHAIAFVSRLGRADIQALLPALARVAPFLRSQIAHSVRLRVTPDLTFQADAAIDYATRIETLLQAPEVARDLQPAKPPPSTS